MNELIANINEWQNKTFPESDEISKFNKLIKEIKELGNALEYGPIDPIKNEIADCMILLIGIAGSLEIDPIDAVKRKHEVNKQRQWGKPDEYGVVEHV